ncbi:MAG: hypothetical protein JWM88_528 [Verrucomicrobia bacterium]|nr:hypothetical protein [Verrucomicrobiota bacterium]
MNPDEQPYGPDYILAAVTVAETVGCRLEIWARRKLTDLEIARAYLSFMNGKDMTKLKNANVRMQATVT